MFFSFFPFFLVGKVATRLLEQQDSHPTKLKKQQQKTIPKKSTLIIKMVIMRLDGKHDCFECDGGDSGSDYDDDNTGDFGDNISFRNELL